MNFVYRHLKNLVYLVMVVFAVGVTTFQVSQFYQNKKTIESVNEIGFVALSGRNALVKSSVAQRQFIPANGTAIFSGDNILTYDQVVDLEFPSPWDKVRVLPYAEVIVLKKKKDIEVFIKSGDISVLSRNSRQQAGSTNLGIYKKNKDGEYEEYQPAVSQVFTGSYLQIVDIYQKISPQGPKLHLKWDTTKLQTNAWVELWLGSNQSQLTLFKTYPFEKGQLDELVIADQFFWSMRVKENEDVLETTPISFWKSENTSQVSLLYPNQEEVINDVIKTDNLVFKWAQSPNISKPVLKVYSDEAQTQLIAEVNANQKNSVKFSPSQFGRYYWKVVDDSRKIQSELRSFYFVPIVESKEEVTSWDSMTENTQFYYDQPIIYLKWTKNYPYPINKYKISFQYFQKQNTETIVKNENLFTEKNELYFKIHSSSSVKVKIQAYNSKMQRLGKVLEKTVDLVPRPKNKLLVFTNERVKNKNILVSDRNYSVTLDPSSVSAIYKYSFNISTLKGENKRVGHFYKGQSLNLKGLPIDYYKIDFTIEPRVMSSYFESQYLQEQGHVRRPASDKPLALIQSTQVKLIPPVDFNVEPGTAKPNTSGQIITPQVQDVQLKE